METKASYINNEFYLIRTKNNSTFIYDVSNTNYYEFKESEDIPLAIQEHYNAGDFVRALKSLDDKATDKSRLTFSFSNNSEILIISEHKKYSKIFPESLLSPNLNFNIL